MKNIYLHTTVVPQPDWLSQMTMYQTWMYTVYVSFMGTVAEYVVSTEYHNWDVINPTDSHGYVVIHTPTGDDAISTVEDLKLFLEGMANLGADIMFVSASH